MMDDDKNGKSTTEPIPGYVRVPEAAKMIGITPNRLNQHIRNKRISATSVGNTHILKIEDVLEFKANPTGRKRTKQTSWHIYKGGATVLATKIDVKVRPGQQELLVQKLQEIQAADHYTFPGTIARYIIEYNELLHGIHILLIWKSTDMPDEETRQEQLAAFQEELADVLDWETAEIKTTDALLYT